MQINCIKAELKDAKLIHDMQVKSFLPLFLKYQDENTSPANESLEKIISRLEQPSTDYYLITCDHHYAGVIRIVKRDNQVYRVSPIFILPEYQGKGIAQMVLN